jgi:hypothetical protein
LNAYVDYLNILINLIEKVRDTQDDKFDRASDIIVNGYPFDSG